MDKERLKQLAERPDFIPGIYHYCDHWCERCPFTRRCMNYAMSQEDFQDMAYVEADQHVMWDRMKETFDATLALLQDLAERAGIEIDESFATEEEPPRPDDRDLHDHALAHVSRQYAARVDRYFEQAPPNTPDPALPDDAGWRDAVDVIRWYREQIHVKLIRALRGASGPLPVNGRSDDADGSAKVALLGMDRSIDAWCQVWSRIPAHEDAILPVLVLLERLRAETERHFPRARGFVRPGFDDGETRG